MVRTSGKLAPCLRKHHHAGQDRRRLLAISEGDKPQFLMWTQEVGSVDTYKPSSLWFQGSLKGHAKIHAGNEEKRWGRVGAAGRRLGLSFTRGGQGPGSLVTTSPPNMPVTVPGIAYTKLIPICITLSWASSPKRKTRGIAEASEGFGFHFSSRQRNTENKMS